MRPVEYEASAAPYICRFKYAEDKEGFHVIHAEFVPRGLIANGDWARAKKKVLGIVEVAFTDMAANRESKTAKVGFTRPIKKELGNIADAEKVVRGGLNIIGARGPGGMARKKKADWAWTPADDSSKTAVTAPRVTMARG